MGYCLVHGGICEMGLLEGYDGMLRPLCLYHVRLNWAGGLPQTTIEWVKRAPDTCTRDWGRPISRPDGWQSDWKEWRLWTAFSRICFFWLFVCLIFPECYVYLVPDRAWQCCLYVVCCCHSRAGVRGPVWDWDYMEHGGHSNNSTKHTLLRWVVGFELISPLTILR